MTTVGPLGTIMAAAWLWARRAGLRRGLAEVWAKAERGKGHGQSGKEKR